MPNKNEYEYEAEKIGLYIITLAPLQPKSIPRHLHVFELL